MDQEDLQIYKTDQKTLKDTNIQALSLLTSNIHTLCELIPYEHESLKKNTGNSHCN